MKGWIIILLLLPVSYVATCTIIATDGQVLWQKIKKLFQIDGSE